MVASGSGQASLIGKSLGNYAVKALIGRGAMGAVYLARDEALGRSVALKVLLGSLARNPEQVRRFQREAQAAAPLRHPNIVAMYEAGIREGTPFIAMEYVEGEPLDRFLRRRSGTLKWQNALHIAHQVAEALACAHAHGIVHRDVKPANILLDHQGRIRLTDFGIASACEEHAERERQDTGSNPESTIIGTPDYMAPEQCTGEEDTGPACDLFSLGVTLYQMLSGRMPFSGRSTVALMNSIVTETPPRLSQLDPSIPDDVARLVAHLLEKDPAKRPPSAKQVCDQIRRIQKANGGASALPEALNAFIREETRPRTMRADTPTPVSQIRSRPKLTYERRRYWLPISIYSKAAVALMLFAAFAGAGYWRYAGAAEVARSAPAIDMAFRTLDDGVATALPGTSWRVDGLRWFGKDPVLLAEVEGLAGSMTHGARGLLAVNPVEQCAWSLRAPQSAALDAGYWQRRTPVLFSGGIPESPESAPFHGALPVQYLTRSADAPGAMLLTAAQRWNEAAPRRQALHRLPVDESNPLLEAPWASAAFGGAALHPNGRTLCLLLWDGAARGNYLIERDVSAAQTEVTGERLAAPGIPIIPGTPQYAPNGEQIAYMRRKDDGNKELWAAPSGGNIKTGRLIAAGRLGDAAAFHPSAPIIAIQQTAAGASGHIALIRTDSGEIEAKLPGGLIVSECWHPTGRYLIAAAPDPETGKDQLWAIGCAAPYPRRRITRLPEGVQSGGAVSRDGRWAAVVTGAPGSQNILFVDLSMVLLAA